MNPLIDLPLQRTHNLDGSGPKVYLIAEPTRNRTTKRKPDTSSLTMYGDVITILPEDFRAEFKPDEARKRMTLALQNYREDVDHIAWAGGPPVALFIAGTVLSLFAARASWLRFEGNGNTVKYNPVTVEIE